MPPCSLHQLTKPIVRVPQLLQQAGADLGVAVVADADVQLVGARAGLVGLHRRPSPLPHGDVERAELRWRRRRRRRRSSSVVVVAVVSSARLPRRRPSLRTRSRNTTATISTRNRTTLHSTSPWVEQVAAIQTRRRRSTATRVRRRVSDAPSDTRRLSTHVRRTFATVRRPSEAPMFDHLDPQRHHRRRHRRTRPTAARSAVTDGRIVARRSTAAPTAATDATSGHRRRRAWCCAPGSSTPTPTTTRSSCGTRRRRRRTSTASPRSSAATAASPSRPSPPATPTTLRRMMAKVEGMPLAALEQGVDWSGRRSPSTSTVLDGRPRGQRRRSSSGTARCAAR